MGTADYHANIRESKRYTVIAAIPEIAHDKCTGCGDCVEWCPAGIVRLISGKAAIVRPEDCNYCTDCEVVCLPGAIKCPFEIVLVTAEPERSLEEQ